MISRWPGVRPWALSVLSSIAVFEFLAALAWRPESGRLFDPTLALVTIPAGAFALMMLAGMLASVFRRMSVTDALVWIARLLPFTWVAPLLDLVRSYGNGIPFSIPLMNGKGLVFASVTGGLLPVSGGFVIGIRAGVFAFALGLGIGVWHARKSVVRGVSAAIVWSVAAVHLIAARSAMLFWGGPFESGAWNAASYELNRHALSRLSSSYWWNSAYERFPAPIASQPAVAAGFMAAAFALFAFAIFMVCFFAWTWRARILKFARHVFVSGETFELALCGAIGIGAAVVTNALPKTGGVGVFEFIMFVFVLAALRLSAAMKRDLAALAEDERSGKDQPIARGELAPDDARSIADASLAFALAGAWVFGWNMFAPMLVALAALRLWRDRFAASSRIRGTFRALAFAALAFASACFISEASKITPVALSAAAIAAIYPLFIEYLWLPKLRRNTAQIPA